jgi:glyoxylase-like metal-dependent hydrolase (beta-lactamase superfamily II)
VAQRVRIGSAEIAVAADAAFTLNTSGAFPNVPAQAWRRYHADMPDSGEIPSRVLTFVVRSQGKTILVDSGVGEWGVWRFGDGSLLSSLAALDVKPDEIDFVVPTHMHIDHVGWNTRRGANGQAVPTFPRARYIFQHADWDHFTSEAFLASERAAYVRHSVLPLTDSGLMELAGSERIITDEVTLLHSPGHTPGQVAILVQSGGEAALLIGDVCHDPAQLSEPDWSPVFDIDSSLSARSRRAVVQRAKELNGLIAGAHFGAPGTVPFGRIIEIEGRSVWRGVDLGA